MHITSDTLMTFPKLKLPATPPTSLQSRGRKPQVGGASPQGPRPEDPGLFRIGSSTGCGAVEARASWRPWRLLLLTVVALVCSWGLAPSPAVAQETEPTVSVPITITDDAGGEVNMTLGLDPEATEGNDEMFGEEREPPLPPDPSSLVARFIDDHLNDGNGLSGFPNTGMPVDIRQGSAGSSGTKVYEINFATGDGASEVTISWDLPDGVTGTIEDRFGGVYGPVAMEGSGSLKVAPDDPEALLTMEYPRTLEASQAKQVGGDGTYDFGSVPTEIRFSGADSRRVTVSRYGNAPENVEGIPESNVSQYRLVVAGEGLSFDSAELRFPVSDYAGIDQPEDVTIYRRDTPETGDFTALTTTVDDNGTPNDVSDDTLSATTDSFSEFVFASEANALPVELASFDAIATEGGARLTWRTASETGNAGFEVQRQKEETEGDTWAQVGYVESNAPGGTTTEAQSYEYLSKDLAVGTHQFRLKQVDLDGSSTLTGPVSVDIQMTEGLKLEIPAPNPTGRAATLSFAVKERTEATIQLYNTLGQRVKTVYRGTPAAGEEQTAQVDAAGLPSGTYFLRLTAGGQTRTRRLTIVR